MTRRIRFAPFALFRSYSPRASRRSLTRSKHSYVRSSRHRPKLFKRSIRIHVFLSISCPPAVRYSLVNHPESIMTRHAGMRRRILSESAFDPPLPFVTLCLPPFMSPILVAASNGQFVTVSDILLSMHAYFRRNVSEREYHSLSSKFQQKVSEAFYLRCGTREALYRQGLKRIDLLTGRSKFQGISASSRDSTIWLVNVC